MAIIERRGIKLSSQTRIRMSNAMRAARAPLTIVPMGVSSDHLLDGWGLTPPGWRYEKRDVAGFPSELIQARKRCREFSRRILMAASKYGIRQTAAHIQGRANKLRGKVRTPAMRQAASERVRGDFASGRRSISAEQRAAISATLTGRPSLNKATLRARSDITPDMVREARRLHESVGLNYRQIAARLGISYDKARDVASRRRWADIED